VRLQSRINQANTADRALRLERRATTKNNENHSVCDRFSIAYFLLERRIPIRNYEAAIELTYRWKLAESWFIPAGPPIHFPSRRQYREPGQSGERIGNPKALVLGLRTALLF
jgi:hypothetical protein